MAELRYRLVCVVWTYLVLVASLSPPVKGETRDGLCPDANSIVPCVCTSDNVILNMDCSEVASSTRLAAIFQEDFPFSEFTNLTIAPDTPSPNLLSLPSGVFGEVSFVNIVIQNTHIEIIEEEALTPSLETLHTLAVIGNRVKIFPFETIPLYRHLWALVLDDNMFPFLPDIVSDNLEHLSLSENFDLSLTVDTFSKATNLIDLQLAKMDLTYIPPYVFSQLNYIEIINLSGNKLSGQLETGFMSVPLDTLRQLDLSNNTITGIRPGTIAGVHHAALISFSGNDIETLEEVSWSNLLGQVTREDAIDLRGNPLLCGCDVLWLVKDEDKMKKIHKGSSCVGGILLHDVPLDYLLSHC